MQQRIHWHMIGAIALVCLLIALGACQRDEKPSDAGLGPKGLPISGPVPAASGRLIYAKFDGFWTLEPATKANKKLTTVAAGTFLATPAASPDGKLVAYSMYRPAKDPKTLGGADLHVMAPDGSDDRVVLAHDQPGASLTDPAWDPDGRTLYFTYRGVDVERIERVQIDGSGRTVVVESARSPTVSAGGQRLAYLAADTEGQIDAIWVAGPDGRNARQVLREADFYALAASRFAPNREQIVFAAVGDPQQQPSQGPGPSSGRPVLPTRSRLSGRVSPVEGQPKGSGPRVAYAHGVPWDLWVVNADGTGLRRLTQLGEDLPTPAWSPDGKWIGFSAELGIYLINVEAGKTLRLTEDWAMGGLAWLP